MQKNGSTAWSTVVARLTEMRMKRSLECLRLAADCRNLAWTAGTPGKTKSFLAMADLVVLPQRVTRETLAQIPGKVFEAMAMARPIVATAVSDLPEILDGCGVIVPPQAPDKLGAAIDRLLSRPEEARALGQEARRRCQEHYSWDAMERVLDGRLKKWEQARPADVYS
jgi:glycosyltransferase involved in cell wall biosynthesis